MDNPQIKFSHEYPKLYRQNRAQLVYIEFIPKGSNLHADFIEYDTRNSEGKYYPLPPEYYMKLIFIGDKGIPFCTMRRWTEEKAAYYNGLLYKHFDIVIGG